jgi:pyrophosphatase PpaX
LPVESGIQTVLFDLDDTLLDSLHARVKALEQAFKDNGITGVSAREFIFSLQGSPFVIALKELAQARDIHEDLFVKYRRAYWFNSQDSLQLFPGVKEMLEKLKEGGRRLGIVTSKMHDTMFEGKRIGCAVELEKMGIGGLFDAVVGLEDVTHPKPAPECIHLALNKMGSRAARTMVAGDSAADMAAARAAGCKSCLALWGLAGAPDPAKDGTADFTALVPGEIVDIVARRL